MSASREKKSRLNRAEELTEKQLKAKQEAAQAKRNTIIYTVVGVVAAVLVAALLIWNSGFFQNRAAAVTVGDETYSVTDLQYYYTQVFMQNYSAAYYGMSTGFDPEVDPAEQIYDADAGTTWHDYFVDEAIRAVTEVKALNDKASEEGYKISDEGRQSVKTSLNSLVKTSATNGFSTVNSYLKAVYGSGMNKGKLEKLMTESVVASEFANAYAEGLQYSDEQIEIYYAKNVNDLDMFEYDIVYFGGEAESKKDEDGKTIEPTEDEQKAAMEKAQRRAENLRDDLRAGMKLEEAAEQWKEDGSVEFQANQRNYGSYIEESIAKWLSDKDRKAGDMTVQVSSDETGYYLIRFISRGRDTEVMGDVRHILVAAEQDEGASVPTEAQYEAAKAKAEQLLEQWKAGVATEDSFAELAKAESADPGSASNGGLYTGVSSQAGFIEDFANWVVDPAREVGDTGLVQNTQSSTKGWHIMYYAAKGDEIWKNNVKTALANEDSTQWLEEMVESMEVVRLAGIDQVGK